MIEPIKNQIEKYLTAPLVWGGAPATGFVIGNIDAINKMIQFASLSVGFIIAILSLYIHIRKAFFKNENKG